MRSLHAQLLLSKQLRLCAASLPILGTREFIEARNRMDVAKLCLRGQLASRLWRILDN